ncbi:MAG: hypothetical protein HDR26_03915 [Lachnospiraceae bacterium]|nr:hypothetical protein [Lachnospiraceae bacterium]
MNKNYIREMEKRLKSLLHAVYRETGQVPDFTLHLLYVDETKIIFDDGMTVPFLNKPNPSPIKKVIEKKKQNVTTAETDSIMMEALISGAIGISSLNVPYALLGSVIAATAGIIGRKIWDNAKKAKAFEEIKKFSSLLLVGDDPEEKSDIQECRQLVADTLRGNRHLKHDCYIPPCGIIKKHENEDEECLQLCMYQGISEEELDRAECVYFRTILQLFSVYLFFGDCIPLKNRQDWEQLWNENAIIVNAAQKIVSTECGKYVMLDDLNHLSFMTYENKTLHGTILLGDSSDHKALIPLQPAIDFKVENLRQICKLLQIGQSGYTVWLDVTTGRVTALADSRVLAKNAQNTSSDKKLETRGEIEFLSGKGWNLSKNGRVLIEYKNGGYYIPAVAYEEKNILEKLKGYFGDSYNLEGIVSFIFSLNHGAMVVITTEAENEAKRLAGKDRGYKVECDFNKRLFLGYTCVDGALFLDPHGKCEAFGVIVDGETVVKGNSARGARYNSGRNYVAWKQKDAEIMGKSEKYAILIVSDDGSKDVFTMEDFIS